jgi:hypothetical protein
MGRKYNGICAKDSRNYKWAKQDYRIQKQYTKFNSISIFIYVYIYYHKKTENEIILKRAI